MKLWPERMLKYIPTNILTQQHRDCCALRGNSWGRNNKNVNYIFKYPPYILEAYHVKVIELLILRRVNIDLEWKIAGFRGTNKQMWNPEDLYEEDYIYKQEVPRPTGGFYEEQNQAFWATCRNFLLNKDIEWVNRVPPEIQPKKGSWSKKHSRGCHMTSCTKCGFSLIAEQDTCCPRCEAEIDKTAEPEAFLLTTTGGEIERKRMSFETLRLSNMRTSRDNGQPYWRYVSFADRMWYRRWLGRRLHREDMKRGPQAEDIILLMRSTRNRSIANSFIPKSMKKKQIIRAWVLWEESSEESQRNKVKGKIRK